VGILELGPLAGILAGGWKYGENPQALSGKIFATKGLRWGRAECVLY